MSTDIFAVVADSTRRKILAAVRQTPRPVNDIVAELGVSQPTVSKHLKVLREAGMVGMEARGQRRLYSIQPGALDDLVHWVRYLQPESVETSSTKKPTQEKASKNVIDDANGTGVVTETSSSSESHEAQEPARTRRTRESVRFQPLVPLAQDPEPSEPPAVEPAESVERRHDELHEEPGETSPADAGGQETAAADEAKVTTSTRSLDVVTPDPSEAQEPTTITPVEPDTEAPQTPVEEPETSDVLDPLAHRPPENQDVSKTSGGAKPSGFLASLFSRKRGR